MQSFISRQLCSLGPEPPSWGLRRGGVAKGVQPLLGAASLFCRFRFSLAHDYYLLRQAMIFLCPWLEVAQRPAATHKRGMFVSSVLELLLLQKGTLPGS